MPTRLSIEDMRHIAQIRGGKCLSKEYINSETPLEWRCEKGHRWAADYQIIRQGGWCPACLRNKNKEDRLASIKRIAIERGGVCLATEYTNNTTKILFRCNEGHRWMMNAASIIAGQWCPKCGIKRRTEKRKNPISIYQKIARDRGGKLLSDNYINGHSKLLWECNKGHQWQAEAIMVKSAESWCPYCAGMRKTIKDMQELAAKKGGKCLSKKYVTGTTKLKWQCAKGHVWQTAPSNILDNTWCPICGVQTLKDKQKDSIEKYQRAAKGRGGKLLSEKYSNNNTPMLWQCAKGHQWKARGANIVHQGSWCPYCAGKVRTIEDMQALAKKRNGKCLSQKYSGTASKLKWQCEKEHEWLTAPGNIVSGSWCPVCARHPNYKSVVRK